MTSNSAPMPERVHFHASGLMHPYFREQFRHCPEGFAYQPSTSALQGDGLRSDIRLSGNRGFGIAHRAVRRVAGAAGSLGIPRVARAHPHGARLIHSARDLLLNSTPWIVDVEAVTTLAWYNRRALRRRRLRTAIERLLGLRTCARILPWTEAAKASLFAALDCSRFLDKIEVVYPCIQAKSPIDRTQPRAEVRLLFIGTEFYAKGGMETLRAFEKLASTRPNLRLDLVTFLPPELDARWRSHPGIGIHSAASAAQLDSLYRNADIFVVPTHKDLLGFVYLEAYSYGLPCVGAAHFAVPEIIEDGVTGFMVPSPPSVSMYGADCLPRFDAVPLEAHDHPFLAALRQPTLECVERLAAAIQPLADQRELRLRMGEAAHRTVAQGRFSPAARRRALGRIYSDCLAPLPAGIKAAATRRFPKSAENHSTNGNV